MPSTGISIICAIFTALSTIMDTSSCGDVTTTIPSTGRDWKIVSGTSPVPGGQSTNIQSTSPQSTSSQNCLTALAMTGPLQITGSVSFSTRRFNDISLMPDFVTGGYITVPASSQVAFSCTPKDFGIDGPVISASRIAVFKPFFAALTASIDVTNDLPTPPFPLTTAITFFTPLLLALFKLCGAVRSPQSELQFPQSCVHASLILPYSSCIIAGDFNPRHFIITQISNIYLCLFFLSRTLSGS